MSPTRSLTILAGAVLLVTTLSFAGGTKFWTNASGNSNFGTATNWHPVGVPTAADTAVIDSGVGYAAVGGVNDSIAKLIVKPGARLVLRRSDNGKRLTVLGDFHVTEGGAFDTVGGPGDDGPVVHIGGNIVNHGRWNLEGVGGANYGVVLTNSGQVIPGGGRLVFQNLRAVAGCVIDSSCVSYLGTYSGQLPTLLNGGCFGPGHIHTIAATSGSNGSIAPAGVRHVNHHGSQTYTITPNAGHTIANVLVDGVSVGPVSTYQFTNVVSNHTISATFSSADHAITATSGPNGSVAPQGVTMVSNGGSQNYIMAPDVGYHVVDVLVDGVSAGAVTSYNFTNVTASHTVSATFAVDMYTIAASVGANGSILPNGLTNVSNGGNQTYTITPDGGYQVVDVLVDGVSVGAIASYSFMNVTANHTISATFAVDMYTITASVGANGSILPGGITNVSNGGSQSYTIAPGMGYHVTDVLVDGNSVGAVTSYSFTNVTSNHTISATFAVDMYTITASAGANGTILPGGATNLNSGENQTYTITPEVGYHVLDVIVDGTSIGAVTAYSFTNVGANHTISVSFALNVLAIAASATGNGSIVPAGTTNINHNGGQSYTIAPSSEHYIADVIVDGISVGPLTAYSFTNVTADHAIVAVFAAQPQTSLTMNVGWNMVSIPSIPVSYSADFLFPSAIPNAVYSYLTGEYMNATLLENGQGYWVYYSSPGLNTIVGIPITSTSVTVSTGNRWFLIGSVTTPVPLSSVTADPPGAITPGSFFGWDGNDYFAPTGIEPGKGYWVFVNQPCTITVQANADTPMLTESSK